MCLADISNIILGEVMCFWVELEECAKVDTAFCNKLHRAGILEMFMSKWFIKPCYSMSVAQGNWKGFSWLTLRGIRIESFTFDFCLWKVFEHGNFMSPRTFSKTTEILIVNGLNRSTSFPSHLGMLAEMINCCLDLTSLKLYSLVVTFDSVQLFSNIYPSILSKMNDLTIHCKKEVVSRECLFILTRYCESLKQLSLCSNCVADDFVCLIENNKNSLRTLRINRCGGLSRHFFDFMSECLDHIIELVVENCDNSADFILWSNESSNQVPKLIKQCKQLAFLSVSTVDEYGYQTGVCYDIQSSGRKTLRIVGLDVSTVLHDVLQNCDGVHEIDLQRVSNCNQNLIRNMINYNPNLRSTSLIYCDESFSSSICKTILSSPTLVAMRIVGCPHLSGADLQDIFSFEGNQQARDQLKAISICHQQTFGLSQMTEICSSNKNLVELTVILCCGWHINDDQVHKLLAKGRNEVLNVYFDREISDEYFLEEFDTQL